MYYVLCFLEISAVSSAKIVWREKIFVGMALCRLKTKGGWMEALWTPAHTGNGGKIKYVYFTKKL